MLVNVTFMYHDGVKEYVINALVRLGKTSAQGDDPDDVIDLNMHTILGTDVYMTRDEQADLRELAIIEARSRV